MSKAMRMGLFWTAAVLGAAAAWAGDSAPMVLDTRDGMRIAGKGVAERIALSGRWYGAAATVTADGKTLATAKAGEEKTVPWTPADEGRHVLRHVSGGTTLEAGFTVLGDDVVLHAGALSSSQTWASDKIHLVTAAVTVPSGVVLTIEAGAVVKFMDGAGLTVASGGSCVARGVIFTHIADDTAGGDTLLDGEATAPAKGAYTITGTVTDDDATEYRYLPPQVLTSSISSDTRLKGYRTYIASNSVTVASGATLTLQPGTVLKFASGCQLTVNGTLLALGTRAAPIVFTSLKDDEHGGDSNGDGEVTVPQPGDWYQIKVAGKADFDHCSVLYASSTENYGGLEAYGGSVAFDNGEIAHMKYDSVNAHSSGTFTARNTTIWDGSLGLGYYGSGRVKLYNCVFQGLTTAVRQSGKLLVNCIFSDCKSFTDQGGDGSSFDHCVFFNPAGFGAQSYAKAGSNGNVWGDPLFADPDNGDFRLSSAASPCVDAADTTKAPETDFYGQERLTVRYSPTGTPNALGAHADIGLHEFLPENEAGIYDLAAKAVSATAANAVPGQKLAVSWSVANAGKRAVPDAWHDVLALVSVATGKAYPLGEPLNPGVLGAGAERNFTGSFAVPVVPEGTYRLRLTVNSRRSEVPEGASTANNAVLSDGTVEVAIPATAASAGASGKVAAGASAAVAFSVPVGAGDLLLRVSAPAGGGALSGRVGLGHLPADAASGTALVFADGEAWLMVPAGTETVWLVLDNGGAAEAGYAADFRAGSLSLASVAPATLPASGKVTLQITGAGFTDACRVTVGGVAADAVRCLGDSLLAAIIDCGQLAAGSKPAVTVAKGAETKTLANALAVSSSAGEGKFWAKLSVPESVREGRLVQTCFVEYGNSGTADMASPVLQVAMAGNGTLGYIGGLQGQTTLQFVAAGNAGSAGILRPGETHRFRFALRAGASNKISLHSSIGSTYAPAPWSSAAAYLADLSAAATRIGLRGADATDYEEVLSLAKAGKAGNATSAIFGRIVDEDGAPASGVLISFASEDGGTRAEALTDESGHFCTTNLAAGSFTATIGNGDAWTNAVRLDGKADVALGDISICNAFNFRVTVTGADPDGLALAATELVSLEVHPAIVANGGNAEFRGLPDGLYLVEACDTNGIRRAATVLVANGTGEDVALDFGGDCSLRIAATGLADAAECFVAIFRDGAIEGTFNFDAAGNVVLTNLPAGDYLLFAGRDGSEDVLGASATLADGGTGEIAWDATGRLAVTANASTGSKHSGVAIPKSITPINRYESLEANCEALVRDANTVLAIPLLPPQGQFDCEHNRRDYERTKEAFQQCRLASLRFLIVLGQYRSAKYNKWAQVSLLGPFSADLIAGIASGPGGGIAVGTINSLLKYFADGGMSQSEMESKISDTASSLVELVKNDPSIAANMGRWGSVASAAAWLKNVVFAGFQGWDLGKAFAEQTGAEERLKAEYENFHAKLFEFEFHHTHAPFHGENGVYSHKCDEERVQPETPYQPPVEATTPKVPQSWDPNEMAGPEGTGADRTLLAGETYEWTIYFENKTNATAAAAEVRVTQQLSPQLDWTSFQMVEVSFGETTDIGLAGKANGTSETNLAGTNWTVRTEVALDATNGVVAWYLRVVDPAGDEDGWPLDPTAGFLPPNDATHRGEGHLTYRVKVKADATENARIDASATIVFDTNDPIPTDPAWWNTVAWRSFAVKFNANGGTGTMAAQRIPRDAATKLSANKFKRSGFTFIGWSRSKTGKVEYADAASVKNLAAAGGNVTLYAHWAKNAYKVAFNANGGTGKMAAQAMTYGKAAKLRKNVFTRKDCVFIGWATSKSGKVAYKNAQAVKNLRTDGKTTTLYAKWAKTKYAVAFNANGGKGSMKTQAMTYNKAAKLTKNAFTRNGWTFLGWATKKNGAVAYKNAQAVKNLRTDGKTTTLYAVWAKNAYKVAFNANGGTGSMAAQKMTYGKAAKLRKNAFKRTGYTFAGWGKTAGGAVAYKDAASVKNLRTDGGTTTLYAKWTATTYKIAFNANGGTGTMATQSVKYDTAAKLAATAFTRDGFTFAGWAKTATGAVAYKDAASVKNLRSDGGTVTLFAVWAENPKTETASTPVAVPYAWLDGKAASFVAANGGDYEAAAKAKAANGVNTVWECYVAGLDPGKVDAAFTAELSIVDGKPVVTSDPAGQEGRRYTVEAKKSLTDGSEEWTDVTGNPDPEADGYRFFRVGVSLPQ